MSRTMSYYDLRDAMREPGCPVCRLRHDSVEGYIESLLWESVTDPDRRRALRRSHGFCYRHAWALVRVSASLGVAIIGRDVLETLRHELERGAFQAVPTLSFRRVQEALDSDEPTEATAELVANLEPEAPCPACEWADKMEGLQLKALVGALGDDEEFRALYTSSDGLCLPHFRKALERVRSRESFDALVDAQQVIWNRLIEQLDESIRKNDHRYAKEAWGEETGSWIRLIATLVGSRPEEKREERDTRWSFS